MRRIPTLSSLLLLGALLLASPTGAYAASARAGSADRHAIAAAGAASATKAYVETFYPRWFTYYQSQAAPHNRLAGPDRISPLYQFVVAINDDTLYTSTFLDLTAEPVILTVPSTSVSYSVLTLDLYGNVFASGLPSHPAGSSAPTTVYALVPPGYTGTLPAGATRIEIPFPLTVLIFRADRFAPGGDDQTQEATQFRAALKLQPLSAYGNDPSGGATTIFPEIYFAVPFKAAADALVRRAPVRFLAQLQAAVHSADTPPLAPAEQALSTAFDSLFGNGGSNVSGRPARRRAVVRAARAAHRAIVHNYLGNRGRHNWIHFTNIGDWGHHVLDRASIAEFIQYGNGIDTAAYYHTFRDRSGAALNGRRRRGYVLTFPRSGQPPADRFWSLTAYTSRTVELIPNAARKYLVASYTPGLKKNRNGSVSIYISRRRPRGVRRANWLPVSKRPFNLMLRVYGVKAGSSVADNTYVPPPVVRRKHVATTVRSHKK